MVRIFLLLVGLSIASCQVLKTDSDTKGLLGKKQSATKRPRYSPDLNNLNQCLAIRGNGHYVVAHFGAVAGIVEQFGEMDAMAGGSSSSFTMYMYDSILRNPIVQTSSGRLRELNIATLMKSGIGWIDVFRKGRDVQAIKEAVAAFQKTQTAFAGDSEDGPQAGYDLFTRIKNLFSKNPDVMQDPWGKNWQSSLGGKLDAGWDATKAAIGLRKVLSSEDLRDLVNPDVLEMLSNQNAEDYVSYRYKVAQIVAAAKTITAFSAKHADLIFRRGVVNFEGLGRVMTRIADFYAGHAMADSKGMKRFLNNCAHENNVNVLWGSLKSKERGYSCEKGFVDIAYNFRELAMARSCRQWKQRLKRSVLDVECYEYSQSETWLGEKVPVILTTGLISGPQAVAQVRDYEQKYLQDQNRPSILPLDFSRQIKFGYWSHPQIAQKINANLQSGAAEFGEYKGDYKLQRLQHIGDALWKTPFLYSPAEPGLSRYVEINKNLISIGGWSDLFPIRILKLAGCKEVIYLGRIGADVFLTQDSPIPSRERDGVAEVINIQEEERLAWYASTNESSSFVKGIKAADLVWCTDWNSFTDLEQFEMYSDAYKAKKYLNPKSKILRARIESKGLKVDDPGTKPILGCYFP